MSRHSKAIEADLALEENRYADAVELYREALLLGENERTSVVNMRVAGDMDRVAFCKSWVDAQPSSVLARVAVADAYLSAGMAVQSFQSSNEALKAIRSESDQQTHAHLVHFQAAVESRNYQAACTDFSFLWEEGAANWRGVRGILLKRIAALNRPDDRVLLDALLGTFPCETLLRAFVTRKSDELTSLAECLKGGDENE